MYQVRVIPCLLLRGNGLVKTKKFKDSVYVGDPINAARIFSEKEVDELVVLDIDASLKGTEPNYDLISEIAGECFMPLAYGGGVRRLEQVRQLIRSGVEKIVINTAAYESQHLISEVSKLYGSQAIVAAVDVRKTLLGGYKVMKKSATIDAGVKLEDHVKLLEKLGAGEIFITNADREGTMLGYDLDLIRKVAAVVTIPVIANGGAGTKEHLRAAVQDAGASAVAAGSMFVFHGKHRAVLINYPENMSFDDCMVK